jgi:hypothetical protein
MEINNYPTPGIYKCNEVFIEQINYPDSILFVSFSEKWRIDKYHKHSKWSGINTVAVFKVKRKK